MELSQWIVWLILYTMLNKWIRFRTGVPWWFVLLPPFVPLLGLPLGICLILAAVARFPVWYHVQVHILGKPPYLVQHTRLPSSHSQHHTAYHHPHVSTMYHPYLFRPPPPQSPPSEASPNIPLTPPPAQTSDPDTNGHPS